MEAVGLEICILRKRARVRQYELAARLGIDPSKLSKIETGREEAPDGLIERAREVLA